MDFVGSISVNWMYVHVHVDCIACGGDSDVCHAASTDHVQPGEGTYDPRGDGVLQVTTTRHLLVVAIDADMT
jgi:hypothetical protein